MAGKYRLLVSPATDPEAFTLELPFEGFSFSDELNGAGSASVSLPLRNGSGQITLANIDVAKDCLWIERDGVLLWGGIVWDLSGDVGANSFSLNAAGFHSYTKRRYLRQTANYVATDQTTIASSLLALMEATAGSLGIIGAGVGVTGVLRDRRYDSWERKNFGEAIEELAAVEGGFDFRYQVSYEAGVPTVVFRTTYPPFGNVINSVLELGSNVELLGFQRDGSLMTNEVDALGAGEGPDKLIRTRTDPASLTEAPLLQAVESFTDIIHASTLSAHAGRILTRGVQAVDQYSVRLSPDAIPRLGSYRVGDIVRLKGKYGWLNVDDSYRIVTMSVTVGSEGEVVDLTLATLSAFQ